MIDTRIMTFKADPNITGDGRGTNFHEIQDFLGKRPGDKVLDPFYLRRGIGNKPYFWDIHKKKWIPVRVGDMFYFDNDGIPVHERV